MKPSAAVAVLVRVRPKPPPFAEAQKQFRAAYYRSVLSAAAGNVSEAARLAGMDRSNFKRLGRAAGVRQPMKLTVVPQEKA